MAYAAPEPGARRRTKAEYELIAGRRDSQLDLLNRQLEALSTPELPDTLTYGDLEQEWPALPFYARRRIVGTLAARVTLLPTDRAVGSSTFVCTDRLDLLKKSIRSSHKAAVTQMEAVISSTIVDRFRSGA